MATLSDTVEYVFALAGTKLVGMLSPRGADRFAAGLGQLVYRLYGSRRRVALDNLRQALGEQHSGAELEDIARDVFQSISRSLIEMARFPVTSRERLDRIVVGPDKRVIDEALARGNGAMVCTAHFGNWEMLGAWFAVQGYPMDLLVGVQHNAGVDRLLTSFRRAMGVDVIPAQTAARQVIRSLRANHLVGIAGDQHTGSGLPIDFFGRRALAARGPAMFAVKSGAPMLPFLMRRESYDRHVFITGDPIYPPENDDSEQAVDDMTRRYHRFLEDHIRRCPGQWMWTHRRWK
ncbi:MAG: lysophospholipid acyltransferase family protein [Bacteroidetes bacterium]|nr:lysophospholipid acyltransferase family protein [Bacteroidota bacterium]